VTVPAQRGTSLHVHHFARRIHSTLKTDSHIACRAHAVPLPCRAAKGLECLSHLIYTVRPCLISHLPCRTHAMLRLCCSSQGHSTARPSLDGRAVLCCGLEKNGVFIERHILNP
jgi:hypothetical protein